MEKREVDKLIAEAVAKATEQLQAQLQAWETAEWPARLTALWKEWQERAKASEERVRELATALELAERTCIKDTRDGSEVVLWKVILTESERAYIDAALGRQ